MSTILKPITILYVLQLVIGSQFLNENISADDMLPGINFHGGERYKEPYGSPAFWYYVAISCSLTCFAGLMSGLTVGYLSIDKIDLEVKMAIGTPSDKACVRN